MKRVVLLLFMIFCFAFPVHAEDNSGRLTDLKVIPLKQGANKILKFAPDGRGALIIKGWRDNGNAHGYNLFLVMLDGREVVGVENDKEFLDTIRDDPHCFEDAMRSIRFAHGKLDGRPATFLVIAKRDLADSFKSFYDPAHVVFSVFQLVRNEGKLGVTRDYFQLFTQSRSQQMYCNSDLALFKEFGLSLPDPYEGPNQTDGCIRSE